jgi:hypothetical protein
MRTRSGVDPKSAAGGPEGPEGGPDAASGGAGGSPEKPRTRESTRGLDDQALIDDLKRVAGALKQSTLSEAEYGEAGRFNFHVYLTRFGTWKKATALAGLRPSRGRRPGPDDLFNNLVAVWMKLRRRPTSADMRAPVSKYSITPYLSLCGTWKKTMKYLFMWLQWDDDPLPYADPADYPPGTVLIRPGPEDVERPPSDHKTQRKPSLRMRFRVMQRDAFRCRLCGRSPAAIHGLELVIDHVVPWSKGGETVDENLQTLCSDCNYGKFDQHKPQAARS